MALLEEVLSDLEQLIEPASGEQPAGRDLDGTLELNALEMACLEPDEAIVEGIERVDARNWREIREQASGLLRQSKDLRVAVQLARSLLELEGLPGFCIGVSFLSALAHQYWFELYPALDPHDADVTMRVNAIQELTSPPFLAALRGARFVALPGLGTIHVNDVLVAKSSALARPELAQAPSHHVFAAVDRLGSELLREHLALVQNASQHLKDLSRLVSEQTGVYLQLGGLTAPSGDRPGLLDALEQALSEEHARLAPVAEVGEALAKEGAGGEAAGRSLADISRREDVVMLLDRICAYYARVEPSSPVPLLLQRAKRLVTMDFVAIVRELADQGLAQVGNVAGISVE